MQLNVKVGDLRTTTADVILFCIFEGEPLVSVAQAADAATDGAITELVNAGDFKGEHKQTALLYTRGAITASRIALVGLGKNEELDLEKARQAVGKVVQELRDLGIKTIAVGLPPETPQEIVQAAAEASRLALYQFNEHKTEGLDKVKSLESITFLVTDETTKAVVEEAVAVGDVIANGTNLARDLSNQPGNHLTPAQLAEKAQAVASATGLSCTVFDKPMLEEKGFGALLAVGQGSVQEPRFMILEHTPEGEGQDQDTLVLVGKGITFDTGGISLKPGEKMDEMKHDMSGAAAVIGSMQVIGQLKPNVHVVGVVAAAENMPSANAIKPGDVVTAYGGKTIEILNTDAEGRLVLADALGCVAQYNPKCVVDLATLTGACLITFGHVVAGAMGTDAALMAAVKAAGEKTHERVWELPLLDDYDEDIKSKVADVKNIGAGRNAGTIAGGMFLKKFVENYPWVHLDIAGTAWGMKGSTYIPEEASGWGVRLLVQLVRDWVS